MRLALDIVSVWLGLGNVFSGKLKDGCRRKLGSESQVRCDWEWTLSRVIPRKRSHKTPRAINSKPVMVWQAA